MKRFLLLITLIGFLITACAPVSRIQLQARLPSSWEVIDVAWDDTESQLGVAVLIIVTGSETYPELVAGMRSLLDWAKEFDPGTLVVNFMGPNEECESGKDHWSRLILTRKEIDSVLIMLNEHTDEFWAAYIDYFVVAISNVGTWLAHSEIVDECYTEIIFTGGGDRR